MPNVRHEPSVDLDRITFVGEGLNRPECVLAHRSGLLFCSDSTGPGGVSVLHPDGRLDRILARDVKVPLRPNGIALLPGGAFLLAHLGDTDGGVYRLDPDGHVEPFLLQLDGTPLPPSNFVVQDEEGRVWICVSTRLRPRDLGYRTTADDGFIIVVDRQGARIVADGIGYTNECVVDLRAGRLFVNETYGRRILSFRIGSGATLSDRSVIAAFGPGTFPDGLARDAEGGLWVTSVISNRLIRVAPDGGQEVWLEDSEPDHLAWVEQAFQAGTMGREHVDRPRSRKLGNISSLAFGGADRRTGYLGCLAGAALASLPMPVSGHRPAHWDVDLGPLAA
jgi:hypothetical protein